MEDSGSPPVGSVTVQPIDPSLRNYLRKYKTNVVRWISITQVVTAALMITAGILDRSLSSLCYINFCFTGYGIWCGIMYLSSGIVGLCSVKFHPKRKLVLSNMAMNITSASLSIFPFIFEVHDISFGLNYFGYFKDPGRSIYLFFTCILLFLTLIEIVVCILNAAFSCKALCLCCNETNQYPNYAFYDRNTRQFVFVNAKQGFTIPGVDFANQEANGQNNHLII